MADTGSEVAEGATRGTTGAIARMLERRFLWSRPHEDKPLKADGDISIKVRCPRDAVDDRAEEVLEALERMKVGAECTIDDRMASITLRIPRDKAADAQRALERLHASKRSDFTLDDTIGLDLLEEETGRRTLGRTKDEPPRRDATKDGAIPIESSVLTFANHPEDPSLDETESKAYAEGMRELGFDAAHCPMRQYERTTDGLKTTRTRHVVDVGYLDTDREEFVLASTVTLHRIGALAAFGAEDPYLDDEASFRRDYEWLDAQAATRLDQFERNLATIREADKAEARANDERHASRAETTSRTDDAAIANDASAATFGNDGPFADGDAKPVEERERSASPDVAGQDGPQGPSETPPVDEHKLTADEYEQMPARERAKVDAKRIPEESFGSQGLHDAMREQSSVASVLNASKEPVLMHPSIAERVS